MNKLERDQQKASEYVDRLCERRNISHSQPEQFSFNIVQGESVSISAIERELAIAKELNLDSLYVVKEEPYEGSNYLSLSSKIEVQETNEDIRNRLIKQKELMQGFIRDYLHQVEVWEYELKLLEEKIKLDKYE